MRELSDMQWEQFYLLLGQTDLLAQDLHEAVGEPHFLSEAGMADEGRAWFIQGSVRNTVVLFRQELLALTRRRFPWATTVELRLALAGDEPCQHVYLHLSPLPPLP